MNEARDAFLNDLKVILRGQMTRDAETIETIHLDAIEWLAFCVAFGSGTSRDRIRARVDAGERKGRQVRS